MPACPPRLRRPAPTRRAAAAALAALAALPALAACGGERGRAAAPSAVVIATPTEPDQLIPPLVTTLQGKQTSDLLFDFLAAPTDPVTTEGDAGFRPQLARRWQWAPDSLSVAFELDPRARWHDGRPVRAADVRFSFALYTDPAVLSPHAVQFAGIDSVTVRDSLTAVVWWARRTPEQFYQVAYNLAVMPEHLLGAVPRAELARSAFAARPVGSGRYRFAAWERKQRLVLAADTANYRGRPQADRVVYTFAPDPQAALASVLSGQADVLETLRGEALARAAASPRLRTVEYGSLDYAYLAFNVRGRPGARVPTPFADRAVRVAVSQAVDRAGLVQNALGATGRLALGPFTRAQSTADTTLRPIAYDPAAAAAALDALGWRPDPARGGVRVRDGRPLAARLLVPSASAPRMHLAVLVQAQLARVGVRVDVEPADAGTFVARLQQGDFDLVLSLWHADPSPTALKQAWGAPRGDDVGANFGRWANAAFDARLDSAAAEFDPARRTALVRRAYQTALDDAPAVWLYEPRNVAAVRRDLRPVGMRADAWWAGLADWRREGDAPALAAR